MKDIVIFAGTTPWSVLSLSKMAYTKKVKAYVICVDNEYGDIYSQSKYVYKAYDVKLNDLNSFWNNFFLENYFSEKPILYFTTDNSCLSAIENRSLYESRFELCLSSTFIIESFIDKITADKVAQTNGLKVPRSKLISSINDIDIDFQLPIIIKPVDSKKENNLDFKFKIIYTYESFRIEAKNILNKNKIFLAQEYIPGNDSDYKFYIFYRDENGNIQECMGEKTLQTNGIMTIGTTKDDEDLSKISRDFLNKIDYVGIGGIEYKKYKNEYYFIEMSVRAEGFLPISDIAGVSLSVTSYDSLNSLKFTKKQQKEKVKYIVFSSWVFNRFKNKKYVLFIKEFFNNIFNKRNFYIGLYLDKRFIVKDYTRTIKQKLKK